jgi:pimeloyl-ACP methyl ester carboxylesterase
MPKTAGLHFFLHEGGMQTKPPMVLIHGAGGNHLFWPPEIRRIAGTRVLAIDLPGHGRSAGLGCQAINDYVETLLDFLTAAGLSRSVLVGHGMGGAIALTLAIAHPERVAGIGLISSGSRHPIPSVIMENTTNSATYHQAVLAFVDMMNISSGMQALKGRVIKYYSSIRHTLLLGDLRACDGYDVSSHLEGINVSVLAICGTDDKLTPRHFSVDLAGKVPGAALQTIEGAGHLVMLEQPHRVAGLLSVFLMTIPYRAGG